MAYCIKLKFHLVFGYSPPLTYTTPRPYLIATPT